MQFGRISAQDVPTPPQPLSHITPVIWEARGTGDLLSPPFNLSSGVVIVDVGYEAASSSILEVEFLKTDGSDSHRVVYKFISSGEGYYGSHAFDVYSGFATLSPGSYRIQINSEGAWNFDVSQPRRDVGVELPRYLQGSGDGGSFAFAFQTGIVPVYYEYQGAADGSSSLFGISLYKMDGSEKERIIFEFLTASEVPKSGIESVTVNESFPGEITPGVYLLAVESEGDWRIALGAESFATPTPQPTDTPSPEPTSVQPTNTPMPPTSTPLPIETPSPEPIATAEPTPTATPAAPSVPDEVWDRLSALETLTATLQGLISALESRIAALEADTSGPDTTPTSQPTVTPSPGVTPEPTSTPEPSATPEPNACILALPESFTIPVTVSGSWVDECTTSIDLASTNAPDGDRFYRDVPFSVSIVGGAWAATLESDNADTYMLLWEWNENTSEWVRLAENDDITRENRNSGIEWTPVVGKTYSLTLTTYELNTSGDFTFTIESATARGQNSQGLSQNEFSGAIE